ncbi:non-structural maintenance of chromosomes element 3 homolog [Toxorhynchites rutilus septentrionalis]|uniref:non-structural maintenance of chromosomes element 3 homolog n=1 Tax=Toxorhynchites rutilus septentrionalis TaxID=329112 RepID=UPI0024796C1D|nr:non-structural maintenance of chromosomes element 3 homolog [Toxorhynchites rutilus septentrionalis]XP_055616173.1 non-structural maintenance of chromosomes element 3 homolog [Toxorhynchites rutilus septentrionalis]
MPRRNVSMSQPSSSRPTRSSLQPPARATQPDFPAAVDPDVDQLVVGMVKAILNLSVNKHPIKKADLVQSGLGGNGRMFAKVIGQAISELSDVYGYKLVEIERNKTFIVVSNIASGSMWDLSEDFRRKYTLLYLVLGYIFMKNGSIPEQGLWDFLTKLNIHEGEEHQYFGNVRKLITETFLKQAYLVRSKQIVEGMNEDRYFYSWGVRSDHELSKKDILESFCKLMGKPSVCYITQHTAAYGADNDVEDDSMEATQE